MNNKIRQPAVAGSFYPGNHKELALMLREFFQKTKKTFPAPEKIKALVVPHAGYVYSGQTAAWGYRQLPTGLENPHFVLIGPSHFSAFSGLVCSNADYWQTPMGKVEHKTIDDKKIKIMADSQPHQPEHSLEVQLPFLQFVYQNHFRFTAFLTGYSLNSEKAGEFFWEKYPESIFVFSSDLSHYLPDEEARKKDKKTIRAIIDQDKNYLSAEDNSACGREGLLILIELAKINHWQGRLVYYDTSATASGDRSGVVGYSSVIFYEI